MITPDEDKLASTKITPEELQTAFETVLLTNASVDCGTVIDPKVLHAEFGESIAVHLAIARKIQPKMVKTYEVILADYIRFCRMYIKGSEIDDPDFERQVMRSLAWAIRNAYAENRDFKVGSIFNRFQSEE